MNVNGDATFDDNDDVHAPHQMTRPLIRNVLLALVVGCSSSDKPPQPTTPCGQSIAVVGGAIEATITRPDVDAFRFATQQMPDKDCAGVADLVDDWAAYLKAPDPARKRELLGRLDELAAQHRWIVSGEIKSAIKAAKAGR